jgi:hypothetical protein
LSVASFHHLFNIGLSLDNFTPVLRRGGSFEWLRLDDGIHQLLPHALFVDSAITHHYFSCLLPHHPGLLVDAMPRDDLSIDFVRRMPQTEPLDPGIILDDWINRVQNLPEEIRFVQDEIADKDRQYNECIRLIEDRDAKIQ